MSITTGVGVGGGQRVLELSYPLAHLGDLTVELFRIGEDESRAARSSGGIHIAEKRLLTESHGLDVRSLNADRQITLPLRPPISSRTHRWDLLQGYQRLGQREDENNGDSQSETQPLRTHDPHGTWRRWIIRQAVQWETL